MYQWKNGKKVISLMLSAVLLGSVNVSMDASAASTSYMVKVNKGANCVTVYKKAADGTYKPVKAMPCSAGVATPIGTFSLGAKMRWHTLQGPCYGQYCERITKGFLFHSVWYYQQNPGTLSAREYNKLGTTASHGCVRLSVGSAKWIYDHVPAGSTVVIYSSSNPGPLGKPASIKIPESSGWDPTDPNPANPWKNKKPVISGAKDIKVTCGNKINLLQGLTATNTTGYGITSRIKVTVRSNGKKVSKVNTNNPKKYSVTYSVKDEIGRKAQVTKTLTVVAAKRMPTISGVKKLYVNSRKKLTKKLALNNVTVKQEGKVLASKYVNVTYKRVKNTQNVYHVTYKAQNQSKAKIVKTMAYVDKKGPKITGFVNGNTYTVPSGTKITKAYIQSKLKVSDNRSAMKISDVNIKITSSADKYTVVYSAVDQAGNKTEKTIYFVKSSDVKIYGAKDLKLNTTDLGLESKASEDEIINKLSAYILAKSTVTAKDSKGKDCTNQITVKIASGSNESYSVTYSVVDDQNKKVTKNVKAVVTKKDFITMPVVKNQEVSKEELTAASGSSVTTGSSVATSSSVTTEDAVKSYVEKKNYKATLASGKKVDVTVSVQLKEGKYIVSLFAEDQGGHSKTVTFTIKISGKTVCLYE